MTTLYVLSKILTQVKGKRKRTIYSSVDLAVSYIKDEMEELQIKCVEFEAKEGVSKYTLDKHPAGFGGYIYCYNHGIITYVVRAFEFDDEMEIIVVEAQIKSAIILNGDMRRKYMNLSKDTNF